jgi:hypothetical protein
MERQSPFLGIYLNSSETKFFVSLYEITSPMNVRIHTTALTLFFLLAGKILHAQELPQFYPSSETAPDLGPEAEARFKRTQQLIDKTTELSASEKAELDSLIEIDPTKEDQWDIIGGGCSWYCGGGNYAVKGSSYLKAQGNNVYTAESANDLSYQTAWVEGKKDAGIGESITYSFKNDSPRITAIIVANGYMKTAEAWTNNNRVKALKLYLNGEPYGILNLSDTRTDQVFEIGTFGRRQDGKDLVLTFEILNVYKGAKYNDTAITEIYFDGIDVH